jgi:ribosome-binding protein aMBF1 (putative translation factor)
MGEIFITEQHSRLLALSRNPIKKPVFSRNTIPSPLEELFYKNLISTLVLRRKILGLSQEELSNKIGVSDCYVNKWESGVKLPSCFYLMCWCVALNVKIKVVEDSDG